MLSFFRINDPYRLAAVFFILLLIRIPFWIDLDTALFFEVKWMTLGAQMNTGATMYSGIWDNSAPLSSGVYWVIDLIFGRTHFVYGFLAFLLAFFQSMLFNDIILRNNAIPENTYVPSVVYGLSITFSEEFMILSPQLMGLTFFMLALRNVFSHIQLRAKRDEKILMIGIHSGIATMLYFPFGFFFLVTLLVFVVFTGTVTRRYFLLITGFLIPVFMIISYQLIIDNFPAFYDHFIFGSVGIPTQWYMDFKNLMLVLSIPVLFLLMAFFRLLRRTRLTNFQTRLIQAMLLYFLGGIAVFMLSRDKSVLVFLLVVPSFSFFLSHYFLLLRRGFIPELTFLTWGVLFAFTALTIHNNWFQVNDHLDLSGLYVTEHTPSEMRNRKVMVLGTDWVSLRESNHVTPFLNWRLSSPLFTKLDDYENQAIILREFERADPEYIVDREGLFPRLREYFPTIGDHYESRGNGVYFRK